MYKLFTNLFTIQCYLQFSAIYNSVQVTVDWYELNYDYMYKVFTIPFSVQLNDK